MSEKRYFKIFSDRHIIGSKNKYVGLFNQLDKMLAEDDKIIKTELKKAGIARNFLAADKNYLYTLILRSLNDFHDSKTFNLSIKEMLLSIEILFHKGLYHECLKLIAKAEVLAKECENFQLMIDVLMWKKRCSGYSLGLSKAAEVNLSIDNYILKLNNLKQMTDLYYQSNLLQANGEKLAYSAILKKFKVLLNTPELKSEKDSLSFSARVYYHLIYSNYYHVIDDKKQELEQLRLLVNILDLSKTYATEYPLDYISIYNRLLSIEKHFTSSSFFDDIKTLKQFTDRIYIRKDVLVQRVFIHISTHELEYYLLRNEFRKALTIANEIEQQTAMLNLDIEPYHLIYFYYLQAQTLTFNGSYLKALNFTNRILNDFKGSARPEVSTKAELLNIIIHYELRNYSLVVSLARHSLKENLKRKGIATLEEKLLLALIKISKNGRMAAKDELGILQPIVDDFEKVINKTIVAEQTLLSVCYKWTAAKTKRKLVSELWG